MTVRYDTSGPVAQITLDLKSAEGRDLLRALVRKVDVLVENFRPGTMDKLGVGYDVLATENPALVYTAISGFGRTGPNASRPAFDNSGQAAGGLWSMNGYACLLYTSPSPRDRTRSRMPSSA